MHRADLEPSGLPAVVYAYGGWNAALVRGSLGIFAQLVEAGVAFVLAHIRGGGEEGTGFHRAGALERKQSSYDDLYAVTEDVAARGIADPARIAVLGGSNGGLMVAVAVTQRPDLWCAACSLVPVTDMLRYHLSPTARRACGSTATPTTRWMPPCCAPTRRTTTFERRPAYPPTLVVAGANDMRCPAWHARKLVARLQADGDRRAVSAPRDGRRPPQHAARSRPRRRVAELSAEPAADRRNGRSRPAGARATYDPRVDSAESSDIGARLEAWPGDNRRSPRVSSATWLVRLEPGRLAPRRGGCGGSSLRATARAGRRLRRQAVLPALRRVRRSYVGVDVVENAMAELLGPVEDLPVDDASFDVVLCTQVLEHCDDPAQAVRELRRVTAPGGRVLASTHGVQVYHPSPHDYWRWTHEGLRRLFAEHAEWEELGFSLQVAPLLASGCSSARSSRSAAGARASRGWRAGPYGR